MPEILTPPPRARALSRAQAPTTYWWRKVCLELGAESRAELTPKEVRGHSNITGILQLATICQCHGRVEGVGQDGEFCCRMNRVPLCLSQLWRVHGINVGKHLSFFTYLCYTIIMLYISHTAIDNNFEQQRSTAFSRAPNHLLSSRHIV